jgi:hypothetical protein
MAHKRLVLQLRIWAWGLLVTVKNMRSPCGTPSLLSVLEYVEYSASQYSVVPKYCNTTQLALMSLHVKNKAPPPVGSWTEPVSRSLCYASSVNKQDCKRFAQRRST